MIMQSNVTLKLDDALLKEARKQAVEENASLSGWVVGLIVENLNRRRGFKAAKARAISRMEKGFALKPGRISRDDLYER